MVIRKVFPFGTSLGVTLPPAFLHMAKLVRNDIVSVELGLENEIIIKRVDLNALAEMRKQNERAKKAASN